MVLCEIRGALTWLLLGLRNPGERLEELVPEPRHWCQGPRWRLRWVNLLLVAAPLAGSPSRLREVSFGNSSRQKAAAAPASPASWSSAMEAAGNPLVGGRRARSKSGLGAALRG